MTQTPLRLLVPALVVYLAASAPVRADDTLEAPAVTAEARGTDEVALHWGYMREASYLVFRALDGDSPRQIEEVSNTSFSDRSVQPGKRYVYVVKAKRDGKVSPESRQVRVDVPLPAPEDLAALLSGTEIRLEWSRVSGASDYVVQRGDEYGSFREIETTGSTRFSDRNLSPGRTYYYTIEARSSWGAKSKPSRPAHASLEGAK